MSETATKSAAASAAKKLITVTIDGKAVPVDEGATIWDAARVWNESHRADPIDIPGLCHRPELGYDAVGVCRLCAVSVQKGGKPERVFAAACMRQCEDGMVVVAGDDNVVTDDAGTSKTRTRLRDARKTLTELLLAEHPSPCARERDEPGSCELEHYGRRYDLLKAKYTDARQAWIKPTVFKPRTPEMIPPPDRSNFSIAIDHSACILCDRCIRACAHPQVDHRVIGRTGKGFETRIGFDNDLPMKESACVNCGWCMVSCPTGAITYSGEPKAADPPAAGIPLTPEQMLELPLVQEGKISLEFLKRSENGVVIKRFNRGDIICKQGAYENTAFYINSGSVEVYLNMPRPVDVSAKQPNLLRRLFGGPTPPRNTAARRTKPIPIGGGVELDPAKPVSRLGIGTLFGEEGCLNGQARSATVQVAEDDTEIVIMTRNFLDILTRNRPFRIKLEAKYRRWAIENHFRASPLMEGVTPDFLEKLRDRATIVRFAPGQVIIRQGEPADAFYMVRLGHVQVQRQLPDGGSMVIRYMSAGQVFGEIGVLTRRARTATCTALDNVQLVRVAQEDFDELTAAFPAVRERLQKQANEYFTGDELGAQTVPAARQTVKLHEYLGQEIYQGQHMLVLDLDKCTRCDECVNACAQSHLGITRLIRDGLRYDNYLVTTSCRSCRDPKCLVGCPVDAIHRKGSLPIIIEDHCVGCGKCAENCPFGNITMHEIEVVDPQTKQRQMGRQAAVCNLDNCIEEKRDPSCVYACPHDAAHRVDGPSFFGVDVLGLQKTQGK